MAELTQQICPNYYYLVFDDIRKLANEAHAEAFITAFSSFITGAEQLLGRSAEIFIDTKDNLLETSSGWISLAEFAQHKQIIARKIYFMDCYEWKTQLRVAQNIYLLMLNSDPVVFEIKKK